MSKTDDGNKEIELFVAGLVLDPDTNTPIVILKDESGDRCLPIWIGVGEATSIASALKNVPLARPMTHDLLKQTIDVLGGKVTKILITGLEENTFLATIEVVEGDTLHSIDSRPSDALALAVRVSAPIFISDKILTQAEVKIIAIDEEGDFDENEETDNDSSQKDFRKIDKNKWAELLADMDPDDFKYKM